MTRAAAFPSRITRSRRSTNWRSPPIRASVSPSAIEQGSSRLRARPGGAIGRLHIGTAGERLVELPAGGACSRQGNDRRLIIGIGEERHGNAVLAGAIGDAMWRRDEAAIGPALHHIGDIDDETAR